ncbi:MAG: hypothetical protein ACSHX6_06010 [Akkermansiaceae bacterium]
MKTTTSNILCIGILTIGSTAMVGHLTGIKALKNIGLATGLAPYTKVFCQAKCLETGQTYETFAADFSIQYITADGQQFEQKLTPSIYQKMQGPYNRRNVYGAVIAYGPALPETIRKATLNYALTEPGSVAQELGIPADAEQVRIIINSKTSGANAQWKLNGK